MTGWLTAEEWQVVGLSLRVAVAATAVALPLAVVVAMVLSRCRFPGLSVLDALVHLPLVMPPVVVGYLLLLAFGTRGPVGGWLAEQFGLVIAFRWTGAALAAAVMGFPLMVRAIRLSLEAVDPRLEQAATTLGAARPVVFLTVTLPLMLPGILAGAVLAFARSLGEFGATITFVGNIAGETRTLSTAIYTALQVPGGEAIVTRLTLISIGIAIVALIGSERLARHNARERGA